MLSLKLATSKDAGDVIPVLKKLFDDSIYSTVVKWDEESVAESYLSTINNGVIILSCFDNKIVGLVGASFINHMFNRKHKTAVELAFWVDDEFRTRANIKRLLTAYRYWAKRVGCHSILMGKLKNKNEVETYTIRKL